MTDARPPIPERRFGAHLTFTWWKPLVVLLVPPVVMILLQILLFQVAGRVSPAGQDGELVGPLQLLAVNLSMGLTGVLTVPFVAALSRSDWRRVLSHPRPFDGRRAVRYLLWALAITALSNGALAVLAPGATPWLGFGVTATTIGLLAVILLTTPLAALGEELMFRGAAMPAVASWIRPERAALAIGAGGSSLAFAVTHLSTDAWLFAYYVVLGLVTAVLSLRTRGLEAAIAFHVGNNTLTATVNTLLADGGLFGVERGAGSGGPHLLIPALFVLLFAGAVFVRDRGASEQA